MFCGNCGRPVADGQIFCSSCGYRLVAAPASAIQADPEPASAPPPEQSDRTNSERAQEKAVASQQTGRESPAQPAYVPSASGNGANAVITNGEPHVQTPVSAPGDQNQAPEPQPMSQWPAYQPPVYSPQGTAYRSPARAYPGAPSGQAGGHAIRDGQINPIPGGTSAPPKKETQAVKKAAQAAGGKSVGKTLAAVVSVLLAILLFVGLEGEIYLLTMRGIVRQDVTEEIVYSLDLTDLKIDGTPLIDYGLDYIISYNPSLSSSRSEMEDFLVAVFDSEYMREFISETAWAYMDDLFHNTGDGKLTSDDLANFLERRGLKIIEDVSDDIAGEELSASDAAQIESTLSYVADLIRDYTDLSFMSVEAVEEVAPDAIQWLRTLASPLTLALVTLIVCVLAALVVALNWRNLPRAAVYVGVPFVIVGAIHSLGGLLYSVQASAMNSVLPIGKKAWLCICGASKGAFLVPGVVFLAIGVVSICTALIVQNVKKHRKA